MMSLIFLLLFQLNAADMYTVATFSSTVILEHNKCRDVLNNSPVYSIPVFTKTSAEWLSFINNHPPGASLSLCDCNLAVMDGSEIACEENPACYWSVQRGDYGCNQATLCSQYSTQSRCDAAPSGLNCIWCNPDGIPPAFGCYKSSDVGGLGDCASSS